MELGRGMATFPGYVHDNCWGLKTSCSGYFGNRVYCTGPITTAMIDAVKKYYGAVSFQWMIDVDNLQAQHVLGSNGFTRTYGTWPAMYLDLRSIEERPYASGVTVKKVASAQELQTWIAIVAQNFTGSEKEMATFNEYITAHGDQTKIHRYLGYLNGIPASSSLAIEHGDTVSIHWVSTPESYRGKGLGYAVTHQILADCKQKGLKDAVLISSALGKPIYDKMGFKDYVYYYIYVHQA